MSRVNREEVEQTVENAIQRVMDKHGFDKYGRYKLLNDLVSEVVEELDWDNFITLSVEEEEEEEKEYGKYHHDEEHGETYIY